MEKREVWSRIEQIGIVPSIRTSTADGARFAAETVFAAGIPIVEIAMTVPGAMRVLSDLVRDLPGLVVGADSAWDLDSARQAVDAGASAIVVSNHGGRQLDGVAPTLRVLPEVVAAVGDRVEVLLDGGIRRGSDVVKALCLGARAVLVGRAYAYGLAAGGQAGVSRAIGILRADLVRTLKLLGCPSVAALDASYVSVPAHWR